MLNFVLFHGYIVRIVHIVFNVDGLPCREPLVIFSGGMSYDRAGRTPSITVMNGKSTTALEMEHNIVDFVVLCETPWQNGNIRGQIQGNLAIPTYCYRYLKRDSLLNQLTKGNFWLYCYTKKKKVFIKPILQDSLGYIFI